MASGDDPPEVPVARRFGHGIQQAGALQLYGRHHVCHRYGEESSSENLARYDYHDLTSMVRVCHVLLG
jgi:hypothetical protein